MEFPIEYFPASIKEAVEGIRAFTNAPPELVASVALSISSFAVQHLYQATAHRFDMPCSLFVIVLQESGGLKSEISKLLSGGIRKFEEVILPNYEQGCAEYEADKEDWDIRHAEARKNKDPVARRNDLRELQLDRPPKPHSPLRVVEAPTVVGFTRAFQHCGPSILHFSSEAGAFLSGTAMSDPAQARQMVSIMSKVWSGESYDRQTGEEQTLIRDKRVSACWLVQGVMASEFLSNPVFASQGILARFLVVQAPRYEAPDADYADVEGQAKRKAAEHAVARFNHRTYELLMRDPAYRVGGEQGIDPERLAPPIFEWEPDIIRVQQDWVNGFCKPYRNGCADDDENRSFYQRLEEHCARLATVLAVIDGQDRVNRDAMVCAQKLIEWVTAKLVEVDKGRVVPDSEESIALRALRGYLGNHRGETLRVRDVLKNARAGFKNAKEAVRNAALRRAEDEGLIETGVETNGRNQSIKVITVTTDEFRF